MGIFFSQVFLLCMILLLFPVAWGTSSPAPLPSPVQLQLPRPPRSMVKRPRLSPPAGRTGRDKDRPRYHHHLLYKGRHQDAHENKNDARTLHLWRKRIRLSPVFVN
ncbi:hypothetical protein MKX03_030186 [Papaver bracteatum]|nr:hypothetical protein MKX03_030186 [Papaver bracteatum]